MQKMVLERHEVASMFPMDNVVERYARDFRVTKDAANEHFSELKKYLALCSANPKGHYGMSPVLDGAWHTFLMFTSEYRQFCQDVAGRFLDHHPAVAGNKETSDAHYLATLNEYRVNFGEPPAHFWPSVLASDCDCCKCD